MRWPQDFRDAGQAVADQEMTTADGDDRNRTGGGLHAVDAVGDHRLYPPPYRVPHLCAERRQAGRIAEIRVTGGNRDIARGQGRSAEEIAVLRDAEAARIGADAQVGSVPVNPRAAPAPACQHLAHPESAPHPAQAAPQRGFAGNTISPQSGHARWWYQGGQT